METLWQTWIVAPLQILVQEVGLFLPKLILFFILLALGFAVGWVFKHLLVWMLGRLNLDDLGRKAGFTDLLRRIGFVDPPAKLAGKAAFGLCVLVFSILALGSLDIHAAEGLLERFFLYLPNLFVAGFLLMVGYFLAAFLARAALIAAVNAGLAAAGWIGRGVRFTVLLLTITMALEQLGIGRGAVVTAFAIILGGVVLALALSFGLAGKDMARDYLEKKLKSTSLEDDDLSHW